MYKFTNGLVVFTKEDRDNLLKIGYKLVEEKGNENSNNNGVVKGKSKKSGKSNWRI
jgi:hypothetical protein